MDLQQYKAEDFILNDSFVRYCLRSSESDVQFWESWLERYPHKKAEAEKARQWLFTLGLRLTPEEKETEFGKLKSAIATSDKTTAVVIPIHRSRWKRFLRIAAAFMLPVAIGGWWLATHRHHPVTNPEAYTVYYAGDSMRRNIQLADGSRVILNAHSILHVPSTYNTQQRQLALEGEALFEVAKAVNKPFIVHMGNLGVQALGTTFKARAYSFDEKATVSLLDGSVRITQVQDSLELHPGEQLTTGKQTPAFNKHIFDSNKELDWRNGRLSFNNASINDIAQTLEYWYGIKVIIQPGKYKPIRFNGVFKNKPLNEVLAAVCFVNGLESVTKNDTLFILSTKH
ncbi:FecR family protein [Chitinophaga niastensis]|nr:FecR family protein [Chitinophaga niastensis]